MPYVVQAAQGTATTAAGTVTLAAATRAGNTLVAVASVRNVTSNASVTNVTLGGVQDNFAAITNTGVGSNPHLYWWLDPLCAGGQTSVVYTTSGGTGAEALTMSVLEVGGLIPLPVGTASCIDQQQFASNTSASWSSGTTSLTSWPTELWVGIVAASGTRAVTPQGAPWINLAPVPNGTQTITQVGYVATPNLGLAGYSGAFAASQGYNAGVLTFPGLAFSPSLPDYVAGSGPQQGDMDTLVTAPLGFAQQEVVFRATQLNTTTTFQPGAPGASTRVAYDTILEDPYQGFSAGACGTTPSWTAPFTGWYSVHEVISVGTCAIDTILTFGNFSGMVLPPTGGSGMFFDWIYGIGGVSVISTFGGRISGATSCSTVNSPPSAVEITWLGYSAF